VAQLTDEGYRSEMRRLRMVNRAAENREQPRGQQSTRTPKEQAAFDAQQHYAFRNLAPEQQVKLNDELTSMWDSIPAHVRDKARKLVS
jgi:hypothetical protein